MHMADALLSPAVGGTMWAVSAGILGYCAKKVREEGDDRKVPLMGVLGAFVFAAQMVNFTIPGTGSSGHLGGGMILAVLLGPHAAFLVMASVLTVQALFFADGGLLALGCNIFNLGFFPAFVACPLVYRPIAGAAPTAGRIGAASLASAVVGLQLGAFAVVLETVASAVSDLPFRPFAALMLPIHLAIGVVEGLVTAAVVAFVAKAQPGAVPSVPSPRPGGAPAARKVLLAFAAAALLAGGILSWYASSNPDGLEWALGKVMGKGAPAGMGPLHEALSKLQERTAFLPGYGRGGGRTGGGEERPQAPPAPGGGERKEPPPGAGTGGETAFSGIVGAVLTLVAAAAAGLLLRRKGKGEADRAGGKKGEL
jgi:cobalt/nickel transport system permease protein